MIGVYFENLSQGFYAGVAVFVTILLFFVNIYQTTNSNKSIRYHKKFLYEKIELLSNVAIYNIGKITSKKITIFLNLIFGKPSNYKITNDVFWNWRSTLYFVVFTYLINYYIINIVLDMVEKLSFIIYPIQTLTLLFISAVFLSISILSGKELFSEKSNFWHKILKSRRMPDYYYLTIIAFIHCLFIFFIIEQSKESTDFLVKHNTTILFTHYVSYIYLGMFSLYISRTFIYYQEKTTGYKYSIIMFLLGMLILSLFSLVAYFLTMGISKSIFIQYENFNNVKYIISNKDVFNYNVILSIPLILPLVIYYLSSLVEVFFRVLVHPIKAIIALFFKVVINKNLHIYFISSVIILLITLFV